MSDAYDRLADHAAEYGATASARIAELEERLTAAETRAKVAEEACGLALDAVMIMLDRSGKSRLFVSDWDLRQYRDRFKGWALESGRDSFDLGFVFRLAAREPGPGDPCATTTEERTG